MPRRKISTDVEDEVLFRANHTCSICRIRDKDVQIHHIDGDSEHNELDNLVVLCLDCHSKVTGRRGLGKSFKPSEVKRFKRSWEKYIEESRKVHQPSVEYTQELISQIDILVCEILALPPNSPRINTIFNLIYELQLWRGEKKLQKKIIEGFGHLSIMAGLSQKGIASKRLSRITWELCWHFVGPEDIPMDEEDLQFVLECIDVLKTLGSFTCEFTSRKEVITEVCKSSMKFFEVGCWYNKKRIVNNVLSSFNSFLKSCFDNEELFKDGLQVIKGYTSKLDEILKENELAWETQRSNIDTIRSKCNTEQ